MRKAVKIFLTVSLFSVIFGTNAFAQEVNENLLIQGSYNVDILPSDIMQIAVKGNTPIRIKTSSIDTVMQRDDEGWFSFPIQWVGNDRQFWIYGDIIALDCSRALVCPYLEMSNDSIKYIFLRGDVELVIKSGENIRYLEINTNSHLSMTDLDFTALKRLEYLAVCNSAVLKTIKIASANLETVKCYGNAQMTTQAYDDLMCQLPENVNGVERKFFPLSSDTDDQMEKILLTNKINAESKGWKVVYGDDDDEFIEIPATTGTFSCNSGFDVVESVEFSLYPTPAKDMLFVDGIEKEQVTIYDVDGRVVKQVVTDGKIDIKDLRTGVYAVEVKNVVKKFVVE